MQIVSIANQKGGVGKTTTAHCMACGLLHKGYKVLLIDLDPQCNLTMTAGAEVSESTITLYDLFRTAQPDTEKAIIKCATGFSIIPGNPQFAGADKEFTDTGREYILREILQPVKEKFDYCIIDTPPTLSILVINALTAANKVVIPATTDIYSLQGLAQLNGAIKNVKKYCNPSLQVQGILINKYNPRAIINRNIKESMERIAAELETKVYESTIREGIAIKEMQFLQTDIFTEYPKAKITEDIKNFINEFERGNN